MSADTIYLALAEDNQLMRNGLSLILQDYSNFELIHVAANGKELIQQIEESKKLPDVILMDIDMPKLNGFDASKELTSKYDSLSVIFLTSHVSKNFIENAVFSGGSGFLSKNADVDEIVEAIKEVYEKGYYNNEFMQVELIRHLLQHSKIKQTFTSPTELTRREIEFIRLVCMEKSDAQIAEALFISPSSAETYRRNLMRKLGVTKSIGLAIYATKNNLI